MQPNAGFVCGALCCVSNHVAKRVQTRVAPNTKLNGCDAMTSSAVVGAQTPERPPVGA